MKRARRHKGFVLLMVVALIPLLGMASIVLTANSRQIITNTRRTALKTHARGACESGIAWLEQNKTPVSKNQPVVLKIGHESKTITCKIELVAQTEQQSTFTVTGRAEDKRFSHEHSQQLVLKR